MEKNHKLHDRPYQAQTRHLCITKRSFQRYGAYDIRYPHDQSE